MKIIERKEKFTSLSPHHGIAYREYGSSHTVTAIVPLNLLIAFGRWFWDILRFWHVSIHADARQAYAEGYRDGLRRRKQIDQSDTGEGMM